MCLELYDYDIIGVAETHLLGSSTIMLDLYEWNGHKCKERLRWSGMPSTQEVLQISSIFQVLFLQSVKYKNPDGSLK